MDVERPRPSKCLKLGLQIMQNSRYPNRGIFLLNVWLVGWLVGWADDLEDLQTAELEARRHSNAM